MIVDGLAKVRNKADNNDFGGIKLQIGDYFGSSKFIISQGFSYFGDIVAFK